MGSDIGLTVISVIQIYVAQYRRNFGMTFKDLPPDGSRQKTSNIPSVYCLNVCMLKKPSILTRSEVRRESIWKKIRYSVAT